MEQFVNAIAARFTQSFNPDMLADAVAGWSLNAAFAAVTFLLYYAIWRVVRLVLLPFLKRVDVDDTGRSFFETVARLLILTLGAVSALAELGINTASILASLGVAGLTIGFAARDALSNIISGVFIFWDRPFVLGDLIEVDGQYGRVDRITLRSTRVVTVDGKMLAIPNSAVVNTTVASYTNFPHLRIDTDITIGVNEDIGRTRQLLLDLVASDSDLMKDPRPSVTVSALNDYNILITLSAWLDNERDHLAKRAALREAAYETLRRAGVEMPYETIQAIVSDTAQAA